jgi:hypothetical protein
MSYMAKSWPAGQQKQRLLENLLTEYGAMAKITVQPEVKQDLFMASSQPSTLFDPLGPFAQQPVDDQRRPSEIQLRTTEWTINQPTVSATSLYNIFEDASYGSQPDLLGSHMNPLFTAPLFSQTQYGAAPQPSMRSGHSTAQTHQNPPFAQPVASQYSQLAFDNHLQ